ncbi:MAG: hypothetical protein AB7P03_05445 [Kofleriaceae bacterium]
MSEFRTPRARVGLILDLVSHVRREAKRLAYLQHPAPNARLVTDASARVVERAG